MAFALTMFSFRIGVAVVINAHVVFALQVSPPPMLFENEVSICPELSSQEVRWLHVPKTGTSFGRSLANCNLVKHGPGSHYPMDANISAHDLSTYVMLFREPLQRLASAIAYIKKEGPQAGWRFGRHHEADEVYERIVHGKTPANDEELASYTGCHTNMVLGRGCMSGGTFNESSIEEAKSRVDQMLMVGLMEEWHLSMCLFNFHVTGKRFVWPCQLVDTRPTDTSKGSNGGFSSYDVAGYPVDDADSQLYAHAKARFTKELGTHNINFQTCQILPEGQM